ncbi:hypothetical protein HK097_007352 [Rhizophlyctis rosea]|uniref:Altered inheritance of mitochondria protein 41 n=1 Tax=Rhizophlyctis rosea TaxID=64517 RepID=A0AAD5SJN4_9FUNG|nr:hypothetical protein HK097_007352 [Rhizophlyctis rosea]
MFRLTASRIPRTPLHPSALLSLRASLLRTYSTPVSSPADEALRTRLKTDLKSSMLSKDKSRIQVIKSLLSDITYAEKSSATTPMPSISTLIQRSLKKRRDAIQQYNDGGRADLAEKEMAEIAIMEAYLPKQMSEEEIATIVRAAVEKVGATSVRDLGKIMKEVGAQVDDSVAPKKLVSDVAKRVLQGSP